MAAIRRLAVSTGDQVGALSRRLVERAAAGQGVVCFGEGKVSAPPPGGLLVGVEPVTEAVKVVEGGLVVGSIDRGELVRLCFPIVVEAPTLRRVLESTDEPLLDLPAEVSRLGGEVGVLSELPA